MNCHNSLQMSVSRTRLCMYAWLWEQAKHELGFPFALQQLRPFLLGMAPSANPIYIPSRSLRQCNSLFGKTSRQTMLVSAAEFPQMQLDIVCSMSLPMRRFHMSVYPRPNEPTRQRPLKSELTSRDRPAQLSTVSLERTQNTNRSPESAKSCIQTALTAKLVYTWPLAEFKSLLSLRFQ